MKRRGLLSILFDYAKTVRDCDNIFVIDEGKVVQSGKHDELMKQEGIYKRFVLDRKDAVSWKI